MSLFNDLEAAFEELEYLVGSEGRSHRIIRTKKGMYRVKPFDGYDAKGENICELNIRNVVGERLINLQRGAKPQRRQSGTKRAVSGMRGDG